MHLSKFGSKVYLLVRSDKLRASKAMQERVFANEKIEILWHTECLEARGDGDLLQEIQIINNQTQERSALNVGGLFFAIGHTPNTGFLDGQIDLDETGYIISTGRIAFDSLTGNMQLGDKKKVFESGRHFQTSTSIPGVFAA